MPKVKQSKEKTTPIFEGFEIDESRESGITAPLEIENKNSGAATSAELRLYRESDESAFEEKRESLLVLAALGMTKEYLGEELTNQKIHKLSKSAVSKYFNRYQLVQGKKMANTLREKGIRFGIKLISYLLPLSDQEKLVNDLEKDELVNRELTNMIGLIVLKGGRFIALASGLIQVANHIVFEPAQLLVTPPSLKTTNVVDTVLPTEKNC